MAKEKRPAMVGIESNAFQELLGPDYMNACEEAGYLTTAPTMINNDVNKFMRILRLSQYFENRKIRIVKNAGGERLVEQGKNFPHSKHDDGLDALEMALRMLADLVGFEHGNVTLSKV
jgi:predicted phage terminase large subunit-like protein